MLGAGVGLSNLALAGAAALSGWFLAQTASGQLLERAYKIPRPVETVPRIAVVLSGVDISMPPVLGTAPGTDLDLAYDTWYAALNRWGVFPVPVAHPIEARDLPALWVMNPSATLDAGGQAGVADWVLQGGSLILGIRTDRFYPDAINHYLEPLGGHLEFDAETGGIDLQGLHQVEIKSPRLGLFEMQAGEGRILVVSGSEHWSRNRMGHCFTVPDIDVRSVYEGIGEVLARCKELLPDDRRTYRLASVE